jgi:hypothetical protein
MEVKMNKSQYNELMLNLKKECRNEDIDMTAEGIREFLQEFDDIGYDVKYEALKIVMNNFKDVLK